MFCNICGAKNDKEAIFCKNCGLRLNDEIVEEEIAAYNLAEEIIEPIVFDDEKEEKPKKKNIAAICAIIAACAIVFGILGYVIIPYIIEDVAVVINDYSSSYTEEKIDEEEEAKKEELEKQEKESLTLCKDMVKDLMNAVTSGQAGKVKKELGFACGDKNTLAEHICKNLKSEFYIYDIDFGEVSASLTKEYFYSMGYTVTEAAKVGNEYIIKVSFTRLDIEKIMRNMTDWDIYDDYNDILKDYTQAGIITEETETSEKESIIVNALQNTANGMMRDEISDADLVEDELEFVVANDDGEWFIVREASYFKPLERELSIE